jgi:putative protease
LLLEEGINDINYRGLKNENNCRRLENEKIWNEESDSNSNRDTEDIRECEGVREYEDIIVAGKNKGNMGFKLNISVETKEQLEALSHFHSDISRIYLPESLLKTSIDDLSELRQKEVEVFVATPHILRDGDQEALKESLKKVLKEKATGKGYIDGVLVRNIEATELLEELSRFTSVVLDHNLYVFNKYTKKFWQENGNPGLTASIELNFKELKALGVNEMELMVYGYLPMMVTAQCLHSLSKPCNIQAGAGLSGSYNKGIDGSLSKPCKGKMGVTNIQDRMGENFVVKNYCDFCYNVMYNCLPLSLIDQREKIEALNPKSLRVSFVIEKKEEVKDVMRLVNGAFGELKESKGFNRSKGFEETKELNELDTDVNPNISRFTRGHFARGVS